MAGVAAGRRGWALVSCAVLVAVLTAWLVATRADAASSASAGWALVQLRVAEAWRVDRGEGVRIGIVDSGADPSASGLAGRVTARADCVGSGGDMHHCVPGAAPDVLGHGTAVAQIASAVAPASTLVVARAVGPIGAGYDDDVGAAIDWAVDHGAQVVNVSLAELDATGVFLGPRFEAAVERAWSRGAIPVLAAGNTGGSSPYGNLDAVVAAATTQSGAIAPYSDRTTTAKWGVAAPGAAVFVVAGGSVVHFGTSVAAPNVSGALALLLAAHQSPAGAVQHLLSTAVPCAGCGHGRIDVAAAVGVPVATTVAPPPAVPASAPALPPPSAPPDPVVPDPSLLDRAPSL